MIRQGDVLLRPVDVDDVDGAPAGRAQRRRVLARGEVTGHAHVLDAPSVLDGDILVVLEPGVLRHEEHDPIPVAPGAWQIIRQREFDWDAPRRVLD